MSANVVGLIPPTVWEVGLTVMNNSNAKVRPHGEVLVTRSWKQRWTKLKRVCGMPSPRGRTYAKTPFSRVWRNQSQWTVLSVLFPGPGNTVTLWLGCMQTCIDGIVPRSWTCIDVIVLRSCAHLRRPVLVSVLDFDWQPRLQDISFSSAHCHAQGPS